MENIEYNSVVKHFMNNDKGVFRLLKKFGTIKLSNRKNYFKHLCTSIVGQQLSVKSAAAINKRFLEYFDNKLLPEKIVKTEIEVFRSLGLSGAKSKYVKDLSQKIVDETNT